MRLPAVAIAAAFTSGIAFGLHPAVARNASSHILRFSFFIAIAVLILTESILLPRDAEKQVEREILSENSAEAMRADVLKIGHHGSKNSTMPEFPAVVQPRVGIISAGENNPYGHPGPELLERLENAGIRVLRTDRDGAVQVMTNGQQLEISCFVACPSAVNAAPSAEAPDRKQDQEKK